MIHYWKWTTIGDGPGRIFSAHVSQSTVDQSVVRFESFGRNRQYRKMNVVFTDNRNRRLYMRTSFTSLKCSNVYLNIMITDSENR